MSLSSRRTEANLASVLRCWSFELAIAPKQESAGGQARKEPKRLSKLHEKDELEVLVSDHGRRRKRVCCRPKPNAEQRESGHHGPGK